MELKAFVWYVWKSGSPRQVIKTAYKAGMIQDEEAWLSALSSRKNVSHTYRQKWKIGYSSNSFRRCFRQHFLFSQI
ncbi:MAG: hypothetical protein HFE73_05860 [Firmicutes bacterium]|nr:hypothetical protein [Bacillota bacterium]